MFKYLTIAKAFVAWILFSGIVSAQDSNTLSGSSLDHWLQQALENNPDLAAYSKKYEAAKLRIPQVATLPDPRLQITQFIESVQTKTGPQQRAIMLNQMFPWFGELDLKEKVASEEAQAVWFAYQAQILSLTKAVAFNYHEYGYTHQAIELTDENLRLLHELEAIVEQKVKSGADLNGLLRLSVEIGKVEDKLKSLQNKRKVLSARIAALLNLPGDQLVPWADWQQWQDAFPSEAPRSWYVDQMEQSNPLLLMLQKKVDSAAARVELAKLDFYPDFSIGINYIQIDKEPGSLVPGAGEDPWAINFSVSLPIYRNKYKSRERESVFSKEAAEATLENTMLKLSAELDASLSNLEDAQRRIQLYGDRLLGIARQALEISKTGYQAGSTGVLEVIDSERSLLDLQLLNARAVADAWQQSITIQALINQPIQL